jgi:radical SAM superfamily enzyme YgiQ (UPF0313 family)
MKKAIDFILINPPSPTGKSSNKDMMGGFGQLYNAVDDERSTKIPVIDLAYVCAQCKKEGLDFFVIDGLVENISFESIVSRIKDRIPEYIFVRTSTPSFEWDMCMIKKIFDETYTKIFVFGPHVQQKKEECIQINEIFGIITSEPEEVIPEIFSKGLEKTPGIWFKKNNRIIRNKDRPLITELDKLEFPAWEFLPYLDYNLGEQINYAMPFSTVLTSRGCPYQCAYCPYPIGQGSRWRARSSSNVVSELKYLSERFGIRGVLFRDAVFTLNQQRTKEICEGIIKNNLKISWRCETRIDCLTPDLIRLMRKAGCIGINIGMESFSKEVLSFLGTRPLEKERVFEISKVCDKEGIALFSFFIIGLPRETKKSMMKTISLAKKLNSTYTQFTIATPYPGTALEKWARENRFILMEDSKKITGYACIMKNENLGPKTISLFYKYANLYVQTNFKNMTRRIKRRGVLQIPKEMAKLLLSFYYYAKINMMNEKK